MISKELFEAVMGEWAEFYIDQIDTDTYLVVSDKKAGEQLYDIHIDTFFFKCKEWALEQGYNFKAYDKHYDVMKFDGYNFKCLAEFEADSEQQSVFDACQWILENKEK